jgi:hypothetical protein
MVPEMWLSACVGIGFTEEPHSSAQGPCEIDNSLSEGVNFQDTIIYR